MNAGSNAYTRVIEDVDGMAAVMADGLEADCVQLEARPFTARWTVVFEKEMVLQFGCTDVAVMRRLRISADRWAVLVPLAVPGSARWNARAIGEHKVMVCAPRSDFFAFDPGGSDFATITVPARSRAVALARRFLTTDRGDCTVQLRPRDANALRRALRAIRASVLSGAVEEQRREKSVAQELVACLMHASNSMEKYERLSGRRKRIVRHAEEFFRRHLSEAVSIAQLSSTASVSERCLRDAFYEMYAMSPKRYLRLWQLHQVRRALRSPDRFDATVTDVATLHGFYELGRFASEYKALFGEVPSQTRRRAIQTVAPHSPTGIATDTVVPA